MSSTSTVPQLLDYDSRSSSSRFIMFNNPIAWAHFKVRGGWKNHLWGTGGYLLLVTAVIVVTMRLNPIGAMLTMWTTAMLGLQLAVFIPYGGTMISNAIRRDISSGLLESHRLMPVSSGTAIFGYLVGPTFQAVCLAAINFIIGTTTATLSGISIDTWLMVNVIVISFVAFLWVGFVFAAFVSKNAFGILFGLMMFTTIGSSGGVMEMVPALNVLITPLIGNSIFSLIQRGGPVATISYAWAFIAQLVFGSIFYLGAMRRYRRDDVPALGVTLGLLLLAAWIVTSAMGIARSNEFIYVGTLRRPVEYLSRSVPIIATLLSGMLLGLAAISAAARASAEWMRTLLASGRRPGDRPVSPLLISCLATLIVFPIVLVLKPRFNVQARILWPAFIVVLSFFVSMNYLLRIFYRAGRKAAILLAMWIILTWLVPIGLDALRHTQLSSDDRPLFSLASPWGELIDLVSARPTGAVFGLIFQAVIAVVLAALFHMAEPNARVLLAASDVK